MFIYWSSSSSSAACSHCLALSLEHDWPPWQEQKSVQAMFVLLHPNICVLQGASPPQEHRINFNNSFGARGTSPGTVTGVSDFDAASLYHPYWSACGFSCRLLFQIVVCRCARTNFCLIDSVVGGKDASFGALARLSQLWLSTLFDVFLSNMNMAACSITSASGTFKLRRYSRGWDEWSCTNRDQHRCGD